MELCDTFDCVIHGICVTWDSVMCDV